MTGNTSFSLINTTTGDDGDVPIELCSLNDYSQLMATCYLASFALSLIGNSLLVCALVRFEDSQSASRLFFLCLASFDLLFTFTLPFWAVDFLHHWVFGETACRILIGAFHTGQFGSLLLLTAMTLDRFCTVVLNGRHLAKPGRRLLCARVACVATWVISISASLRDAINSETGKREDKTYCNYGEVGEVEAKVTFYIQAVLFFILPLVVIVLCYSCILRTVLSVPHMRGRQRTVGLLFCIVVAFFVCFGPYNIVLYLLMVLDLSNCDTEKLVYFAYEISRILAYCHCFVNPVLHMLRPRFRSLLYQVVCCMKLTSHPISQPHINHDAIEMHNGYKTTLSVEMTLEQSESTNVF
ncbi:hypothetical protein ACEWY4_006232 [Coilia grayii]|uniref:G-protein coupled receptors family 1 profile domain-containing protein n=1 Tax=Coilia grayii TaxID=363190 RepID=A0ABD1KD60_9TELE